MKRHHIDIAIIGGGASGIMAALAGSQTRGSGAGIIIYEKNSRVGKKLLATGNGRCNLTNINCDIGNYHGNNKEYVKTALCRFSPKDTVAFFEKIGLLSKLTHGGRVFPYCGQASAVLDVLRNALAYQGVDISTETEVVGADRDRAGDGFILRLRTQAGEATARCGKLIVSSGGKAAPSTGSDGNGFRLLASLGHRIVQPYPALTKLKTDTSITAPASGVRVNGRVSVRSRDLREAAASEGEIQFTAYGLSGPAVMDISAEALTAHTNSVVVVDLMPHVRERELSEMLNIRKLRLSHLPAESFLVGMLNKKLGQVILKLSGVEKPSLPVIDLSDIHLSTLAQLIKRLEFRVKGHTGWEQAQATGGGADTSEFSALTMGSKLVDGLYATGEVLDIYGDCGGYNLQWAWSSGYLAGIAAVRPLTTDR